MIDKDTEIAVFGDSLALGYIIRDLVPARLSCSAISIIADKLGMDVQNYSVFGQTLKRICDKGIIEQYIQKAGAGKKRIAVIELGGNDSDYHWDRVEKNPDFRHESKTRLTQFISMLENKINLLKNSGISPVLINLVPIDSDNYFKNVLSKKYDGSRLLNFFCGDINVIHRHQEVFSNEINKAALKNNCRLLDIRSKLLWHSNFRSLMHTDGIHLNEKGQGFVAEEILKMIDA